MAAKKRSSRRGHSRRGSRRPVRRHGDGQPSKIVADKLSRQSGQVVRPGTRGYIPPPSGSWSGDRIGLHAVTGKVRMMLRYGVGEMGPRGYGVKTPHVCVVLDGGDRVWEPLSSIRWTPGEEAT